MRSRTLARFDRLGLPNTQTRADGHFSPPPDSLLLVNRISESAMSVGPSSGLTVRADPFVHPLHLGCRQALEVVGDGVGNRHSIPTRVAVDEAPVG